jgi:hypothetical protein
LEKRHSTWREYALIEPSLVDSFRSEMTWREFDEKANRFANLLLSLFDCSNERRPNELHGDPSTKEEHGHLYKQRSVDVHYSNPI